MSRKQIQVRRDVASDWTAINPILALGEPGLETDTRKLKFGDGVTAWNDLSYLTQGIKGDKGDRGYQGTAGLKGDPGNDGAPGATGQTGLPGSKGDTGAKGDKGDTGAPGINGSNGAKGEKGDKGDKGDTGATGAPGLTGSQGEQGIQGEKGDKGDTGDPGAPGEGLPSGGTTGQQLVKQSDTDFDYEWETPTGGGDMLASVYDPTAVAGDAFDMDNMAEGADTKIMTAAERTKLGNQSGTNTGDQDLSGLQPKVTGVSDTEIGYLDGVTSAIQTQLGNKQPLDADLTALAAAGNSGVLAATTASFLTADETKLDGIEVGADVTDATNVAAAGAFMKSVDDTDDITEGTNKFATAAEKTKLGFIAVTQAVDLDAMESKLAGIESGADVTDTANVTAAGALMDSEVDADIKTLSLPASTTISTFGASLIDDAAASNARTTLGLGNVDNTSDATKQAATLLAAFPVGSIYINTSNTNPGTFLGGTWAAFGAGRVPVGFDSGQTEFDTDEETGGAKTHTLTTGEIPAHNHTATGNAYLGAGGNNGTFAPGSGINLSGVTTTNTGGGGAHNNLQPYIVVRMWKRTA